jgi:predicted phage terminase large subunit-like protein
VEPGRPLLDLIPALSPEFSAPYHLTDWIELIERAAREPVRGLCALPIRHFKTETTLAGIVWLLVQDPTLRIIFLTHSFEAAQARGKRLRQLARETNVGPTRGWDTIAEWRNEQGGGVVVMSADQSKLGYDCHALIFDDPIDEHGSDDPKVREAVDQTISHYTARCMRRGKPGPVLGVMSRWHPDDPIGRRLQRTAVSWTYVHRPAIIDEGLPTERAFAPDVWDLPALRQMRAELAEKDPTERLWWAQLMGEPKPLGSDLFGPATYYTDFPTWGGYRKAAGCDMAFTVGEGSDWFARVHGRAYGPKMYIQDVTRHKIDAHLIQSTLQADLNKHGRTPIFSYMSGPEVGMAKVLQERGIPIARLHARYNKLVRAQRTIKRWNDGDILVPSGGLWVPAFLHRVACFRGHERDTDDDEIDALVSMCDGVMGGVVAGASGAKAVGAGYRGFN